MDTKEVLIDAFERIQGGVHRVTDGLDAAALAYRVDRDANSIGWLIWHLARVQDHHVADILGRGQAWIEDSWSDRFGMVGDPQNTGYGHTRDQVAAVQPNGPRPLCDYHDAVHTRTIEYLETVNAAELSRIVDTRWDPPVTAGVRLVSVIGDSLQHVGQAAFVRGLFERNQ